MPDKPNRENMYRYLIAVMYSDKGKQKTQKGGTDA